MSEQWPDELMLDEEAGPAVPLSPGARDALIEGVLAQAYPARRRGWAVAAAVLLACIGGGSASAAVYWYAQRQTGPVGVERAPAREVVPRAVPRVVPPPTPAIDEPEPVAPQPAARAAEDWLREGNRLRAARRWRQADEAYGEAARRGSSEAAYVAFVASAGVRLEHLDDARGALHRYRSALKAAPHGALDEEVRLGIADAYRALGDASRERAALEGFLRDHPASPLAEQARARLR